MLPFQNLGVATPTPRIDAYASDNNTFETMFDISVRSQL